MHEATIIYRADGTVYALAIDNDAAVSEIGRAAVSGTDVSGFKLDTKPVLGVPEIIDPLDKVDEFFEKAGDFIAGALKRDKRS